MERMYSKREVQEMQSKSEELIERMAAAVPTDGTIEAFSEATLKFKVRTESRDEVRKNLHLATRGFRTLIRRTPPNQEKHRSVRPFRPPR